MLPSGKSAWTLVLHQKKNAIETKPLHKRGELLETSRCVRDKFSLLPSSRDFSSQQGIPELHFWIAPRFHEIPKEQPNSERSSCWTQQPQPPWAGGFHPQQVPITRKFLCTLDLGGNEWSGRGWTSQVMVSVWTGISLHLLQIFLIPAVFPARWLELLMIFLHVKISCCAWPGSGVYLSAGGTCREQLHFPFCCAGKDPSDLFLLINITQMGKDPHGKCCCFHLHSPAQRLLRER